MQHPFIDFPHATDDARPRSARAGQPVIGLSVNIDGGTSRLHEAYIQSVLDAGGVPMPIPATTDADALREAVERVDGLVLTGGADVSGDYFGEPTLAGFTQVDPLRDAYDFLLLRLAADRCLPVFGICRGVQVINIAFGGTLWQDIPSQLPGEPMDHSVYGEGIPRWKPAHDVGVSPGTVLASVLGTGITAVNSRHHQTIKDVAPGFRVTATAPDGVIEGMEGFPTRRIWGVQWHPENMAAEGPDDAPGKQKMKALFAHLIGEAALFKKAKQIHKEYLITDSHTDTPMLFGLREYEPELTGMMRAAGPVDMGRRHTVGRVDVPKMAEGLVDAVIEAAYVPQGPRDEASHSGAWDEALSLLDGVEKQVGNNAEYVGLARTFAEVEDLKRLGKKAIMLGVENGYAIGRDLGKLTELERRGVVYMTLCHNGANELCDSAAGEAEHGGLSDLGRLAVKEMNRLGIAVDLSHAAETTFYDALEASAVPVIVSHSSARALCDHRRNLTDDQIRALAAAGGVVQVCLYTGFLARGREATVTDAADHIDHIVRLVGEDFVGVGSDFDGGGGIEGCQASNELINLTVELLRRGYSAETLGKIWGGNLRRVIDKIQSEKIKKLNRFTTLPVLLDLLQRKKLTLWAPKKWEDKNDLEIILEYKKKKKIKNLFAICFCHEDETIYHWTAFSSKSDGCVIEFDAQGLFKIIDKIPNLSHKKVTYWAIEDVKKMKFLPMISLSLKGCHIAVKRNIE